MHRSLAIQIYYYYYSYPILFILYYINSFSLWRTYYIIIDSVYATYVGYNLKDLHPRYVFNCCLITLFHM
jgi:hypothetical protein